MDRDYPLYVYVLSSKTRQLLIGFAYDLKQRLREHRELAAINRRTPPHTRLVHFEGFLDPLQAVHREAELKTWPLARRQALIERANPTWRDLSEDL